MTQLGLPPGMLSRNVLRAAIVRHFLAPGRPQATPEVLFMGGGGGAGKSSILAREVAAGNISTEGAVLANPDEVREFLPEYEALNALGRSSLFGR